MSLEETVRPSNFIRHIIDADLAVGKNNGKVATRFPPEPNGYLHIGHAKSIVLNFGIASDYKGSCNLRFDDTNPHKENIDFVNAIQKDVQWLGFTWNNLYYASDYFEQLYAFGVELIEQDKAYVCDLNADQIREYRGTLTEPGKNSPYRDRTVDENLDLFARMRAGDFKDGERILRAKIDMASSNINMRDPALYRIRHGVIHHQTGEAWCIYPMYDYAHPVSDALEGITHSLCTLEFEDHRPFYDWILDNITISCHPQQIEFSRLNLQYTVVSKRKLTELVDLGHVSGWDDPRMPTLAGLRRRGYTPEAIREFCDRIGVTKADNSVEMGMLESAIRDDLNVRVQRRMAVLHPLKVVITNYPEQQVEQLDAANHPQDENAGVRQLAFCRELYIERADFEEVPPKKYKRLIPGGEVRLRNSYVIRCDEIIKNNQGEIIELRCSYDTKTLNVNPEGRKVQGVIHWVSCKHSLSAEFRLYDRLFTVPEPDADLEKDFHEFLNPASLTVVQGWVENCVKDAAPETRYQFERLGYFCADRREHLPGDKLVFNRTVTLKDSWTKAQS